jgi:hypothetical protein
MRNPALVRVVRAYPDGVAHAWWTMLGVTEDMESLAKRSGQQWKRPRHDGDVRFEKCYLPDDKIAEIRTGTKE